MRDLTTGNLYKNFIMFSLPAILSGLLTQGFSIIDTIIAGKYLSENGLAAVGSTGPIFALLFCALSGYAVGFSVYIARLFGAKDFKRIKECILSNYILMGAVTLVLGLTLILLSDKIIDVLQVDDVIKADTKSYFSIYMSGLIFICFNNLGNYTMQAFGDTRFPLIVSTTSSVLHILCALYFVTVLKLGVAGFAISSIISNALSTILYFVKLKLLFKKLKLTQPFHFSLRSAKVFLTYSLPTLLQQMVMYTSDTMISPHINSLGTGMTSAYSVASKINTLTAQGAHCSSKALSNYAAQCIGAGKAGNLKKGVIAGFVQSSLLISPFVIIFYFFAEPVCRAFFPADFVGDGVTYSALFLRCYMPFIFFNVIDNLFHSFFRGINAMGYLNLVTLIGSVSKYVLTLFLVKEYRINGVYAAWVLSWAIEAVVCIAIFISGRWKKAVEKQLAK